LDSRTCSVDSRHPDQVSYSFQASWNKWWSVAYQDCTDPWYCNWQS